MTYGRRGPVPGTAPGGAAAIRIAPAVVATTGQTDLRYRLVINHQW